MPNNAPHKENKKMQTGIKNFVYRGCLEKKKLIFLIRLWIAPVRSIIVNKAPTTKINAIISAHWAKPCTGADKISPNPWGARSTAW